MLKQILLGIISSVIYCATAYADSFINPPGNIVLIPHERATFTLDHIEKKEMLCSISTPEQQEKLTKIIIGFGVTGLTMLTTTPLIAPLNHYELKPTEPLQIRLSVQKTHEGYPANFWFDFVSGTATQIKVSCY